jgi:hypothetical protein
MTEQTHAQICAALAAAQGKFHAPKRTKPVTVRTKTGENYSFNYSPLEEIIAAVKQPLAENGLSWMQSLSHSEKGYAIYTTILHASGETLGPYPYPVLISRDGPQGFASGVTYARRYGLSLALGIAPEDDDDANAAEGNTVVQQPKLPARRPKPPAENVMVGGRPDGTMGTYDPQTGEVTERPVDDEYVRYDSLCRGAAEGRGGLPAKDKLKEIWQTMPIPMQHRLQGNLPDYKRIAEGTDIGYDMAREPR